MLAIKIYLHFLAEMKKAIYRLLYFNKLKIGKHVSWRKDFSLVIEGNGKVEISDSCFFNNNCSICSLGKIRIGKNTILGENVKIYDHNHRFRNRKIPIREQGYSVGEIYIGENCWIGSNVTILKNVCIGDNCVIAAGITLSKNVPDNTIVRHDFKNYVYERLED